MVGNGVIAESIASFKVTWKSTGIGQQPKWDQNDQEITIQETSVYPDLLYTKAQGLATYYKYTSIDTLMHLLKQINSVIDAKLGNTSEAKALVGSGENTAMQTTGQTAVQKVEAPVSQVPTILQKPIGSPNEPKPNTNTSAPDSPDKKDEVTNELDRTGEPEKSGATETYTVVVYGEKIRMIDGQLSSANIRIRHKVSENLVRKLGDDELDNSKKIWLEVKTGLMSSQRMEIGDFTTKEGINLLVQLLPTLDLTFTVNEKHVTPKSEEEVEYSDKLKFMSGIRMSREEERFTRVKQEINKDRKRVTKKE